MGVEERCGGDNCRQHSGTKAEIKALQQGQDRLDRVDIEIVKELKTTKIQIKGVEDSTKSSHKRIDTLEDKLEMMEEQNKAIIRMAVSVENLAEKVEESNTLLKEQDKRHTEMLKEQEKRYTAVLDKIEQRMAIQIDAQISEIEELKKEIEELKDMPGKMSLKFNLFMLTTIATLVIGFLFEKFTKKG